MLVLAVVSEAVVFLIHLLGLFYCRKVLYLYLNAYILSHTL